MVVGAAEVVVGAAGVVLLVALVVVVDGGTFSNASEKAVSIASA